jgi:phytoene synthase
VSTTLDASYRRCRELNRRNGTTYYAAARLLPPEGRRQVHALYGFCRYADDIVDDLGPAPVAERQSALAAFEARFYADLARGHSDDAVLAAVVHTVEALGLPRSYFERFLRSMAMDFTVDRYESFAQLLDYMDGSAAVIGEMMLPVLGAPASALPAARDLGIAFQLTNFWRDVAEDLDRGRVYLPQEDVRRFGAAEALAARRVTPEWRRLLAFEFERTRAFYRSADEGIAVLPPRAARCIRGARILYSRILDRIEEADYDVFSTRARVPRWQKAAVVARALVA